MHELFILGAGFSTAFNDAAPLMAGFLKGHEALIENDPPLREATTDLDLGSEAEFNLETLFTLLSLDTPWMDRVDAVSRIKPCEQLKQLVQGLFNECFRRVPAPYTESRRGKETYESNCAFRFELSGDGSSSNATATKSARLARLAEYLICQKGQSQVVSFNYDLLLENALQWWLNRQLEEGKPGFIRTPHPPFFHVATSYGFRAHVYAPGDRMIRPSQRPVSDTDTLVLKLHGSLNWLPRKGHATNIDTQHLLILPPHEDYLSSNAEGGREILGEFQSTPFIVPPVLDKTILIREPILNVVWSRAAEFVGKAEKLIFLGYSLPPTDYYAEFLCRYRRKPNCQVLALGKPKPDSRNVTELAEWDRERSQLIVRYERVFGKGKVEWRDEGVDEFCGNLIGSDQSTDCATGS